MNLSEVFSETEETKEVNAVEADEQETVETEEVEATVEDDATTTVAEQDEAQPQEDEPETEKEKSDWTYAAYQDEKRKRQELEQEFKKLKEQLDQPKEDDTEYLSQTELTQRMKSYADSQVQRALFQDRLTRHYDEVKSKYDDFGEMETAFAEMASKDNNLKAQFLASPNPAEFAYIQAKNAQLLSKYNGNIQAMLEDVKKQHKVESKPKEEKPASKPRTPSLANATESEKNSAPISTMASLQEIFEDSVL